MKAKDVLQQGAELVSGDRRATHGDSKSSFNRIAALWSAYLGCTVSARDVAMMMALLKITRTLGGKHNEDDYVDGAAYVALASEVSDA